MVQHRYSPPKIIIVSIKKVFKNSFFYFKSMHTFGHGPLHNWTPQLTCSRSRSGNLNAGNVAVYSFSTKSSSWGFDQPSSVGLSLLSNAGITCRRGNESSINILLTFQLARTSSQKSTLSNEKTFLMHFYYLNESLNRINYPKNRKLLYFIMKFNV